MIASVLHADLGLFRQRIFIDEPVNLWKNEQYIIDVLNVCSVNNFTVITFCL